MARLMGIIIRAGRSEGQDLVFEASSEATWTRLRRRLEEFLSELWQLGAFNGATAADAFEVRCGRQTMSQADIDAARTPVKRICQEQYQTEVDPRRRAA